MPLPLLETPVSPRLPILTAAIRREILAVLAESDTVTVPSATEQVAAGWSARRRRRGDSPSGVRAAAAIVCLVGADLVDEVADEPSASCRVSRSPRGPASRCASRSSVLPVVPGGSELLGPRRVLFRIPRIDP
jgi:hypothetical protein